MAEVREQQRQQLRLLLCEVLAQRRVDRLDLADEAARGRGARGAGLRDGGAEQLAELLEEELLVVVQCDW